MIPKGEYGGGDVIVWDRGTWELHAADDAVEAVKHGELHADMYGEKLRDTRAPATLRDPSWANLVRT